MMGENTEDKEIEKGGRRETMKESCGRGERRERANVC